MNLKISKELNDYLMQHKINSFVIGSHLYGTNTKDSDKDILCIYDDSHMMSITPSMCDYLPNYHQFQYDDKENNEQYIWTTWEQFWKNLASGDSTINADVVMFDELVSNPLEVCRTYKVIKAFIGFADRDLKNYNKGKNKLFHAHRSLYCADMLLQNKMPRIDEIRIISQTLYSANNLVGWGKAIREWCNRLYEEGDIEKYYIPALPKSLTPQNTLMNKLIRSNNTKEFKYD